MSRKHELLTWTYEALRRHALDIGIKGARHIKGGKEVLVDRILGAESSGAEPHGVVIELASAKPVTGITAMSGEVFSLRRLDAMALEELATVPLDVLRKYARTHLSIIGAESAAPPVLLRRIAHVRAPVSREVAKGWPYLIGGDR